VTGRGATLLTLSDLIGRDVAAADGAPLGRLRDVGVTLAEELPAASLVSVHDDGARRTISAPVEVREVGALAPQPPPGDASVLFLARDVLDRQIFDAHGKRVSRVADVILELDRGTLRVAAVETGAAGILRRLGLRRLAARLQPALVDWSDLHLLSGPGHALQLAAPAAAVHRLDDERLAELVRRAPSRHSADVLEHIHPHRRAHVRELLERAVPRRRSTDPLSARKRAPS
jgi:sporulation protein YlmC with PRC-barrel domain